MTRQSGAALAGLDARALHPAGNHLLAFSGGPDSTCLLHLLIRHTDTTHLRVVHVDHGMDPDSGERARRALAIARGLGAECRIERVDPLGHDAGQGREAAARHARYARLRALMRPGDHLLTAHHADDQVETVLLRLLRGAGPRGLSGMQTLRSLPPGRLGRPLLGWTRARIRAYLQRHGLESLDDPANRDPSLDRNYLRAIVLPAIAERWPGYRPTLLRAADWQRSADDAVTARGRADWRAVSRRSASGEALLSTAGWLSLDAERAVAVVRHWCALHGLAEPPGRRLRAFRTQCATARRDARPLLDWTGGQLHAWRGRIWLDLKPVVPTRWSMAWTGRRPLPLPAGGTLLWRGGPPAGDEPWRLGPAPAGARLRPRPGAARRRVVDLMRESGIPPWRRHALPALTIGDTLVAVGPDWTEADWAGATRGGGPVLEWRGRPRGLLPSARKSPEQPS